MALDVIKKGVENWVVADTQRNLPNIEWVCALNDEEFFALVSLAWHIVDADGVHSQEEMLILDHILSMRKPSEKAIIDGIGSTPLNQAISTLRQSEHANKCFSLVKMLPEADGTVSHEEAEIIGLLEIGDESDL